MKKTTTFTFAHLLLWLVCATLPLGFTACSDDEDPTTEQSAEPEPEPDADYTVMLYGCGGGNLDDALIYNLSQVEGYGYSDKVQFTGLVKFSVPYQTGDDAQFQGTRLYSLTPTGMENERIADADYRLDNPDHLASFISDAAERMPAEYYNRNDFVIEDANGQQYEYADYAVLYPILKFHRQTGWGNFLSINEFQPKSENP